MCRVNQIVGYEIGRIFAQFVIEQSHDNIVYGTRLYHEHQCAADYFQQSIQTFQKDTYFKGFVDENAGLEKMFYLHLLLLPQSPTDSLDSDLFRDSNLEDFPLDEQLLPFQLVRKDI